MSYVRGREGALSGFGDVLDDLAGGALESGKNSILANAAGVDTKSLPPLLQKANAAADKYLGTNADQAKKAAFEFLYLQARKGMGALLQTAAGKAAAQVANASADVAANVNGIISVVKETEKSGQTMDISGVTNIAGMSHKILMTFTDLAKGAGWIDGKIQQEIAEWSNVAVGCAAAYAMGPVAGTAMCGLQVLGKLIPALTRTDSMPPTDAPRSIFVPSQGQLIIAAADAARLAALLKYKYGLSSYQTIYDNLTKQPDMAGVYDNPQGGTVNEHAFFTDAYYPAINSTNDRRPAIDLRVALVCMRFMGPDSPGPYSIGEANLLNQGKLIGTPWGSTRFTLSQIATDGDGGLIGDTNTSRKYSSRFIYDHDVPVQAIDAGYNRWVLHPRTNERNALGLDAFKRVHELINFYTALTYEEFASGNKSALQYVPGNGVTLPVRLYAVNDTGGDGCRHDFFDTKDCKPYGEQCMTSGERCGIQTNQCATQFRTLVLKLDPCAMRQLGALRLMAAFSYMHLVYMRAIDRSTTMKLKTHDMIANLTPSSDPAITVELPVDVFTPGGTVAIANGQKATVTVGWPAKTTDDIRLAIKAKRKVVESLASQAAAAAKADLYVEEKISASLMQQMTQQPVVASKSDPISQMIKSGALNLQTMSQARVDCLNQGGAWYEGGAECDVDASGNLYNCRAPSATTTKKYYCVPKSTPGATQISSSGQLQSGPGFGTIATVAGAALLLMALMKKR